jgi:effector-binding domain-containing protein
MHSFLKSNKVFVAIISAILAIGAAAFIPVTEKDYIVINAPMNNIMTSVQQVSNWKKWHPELQSKKDSVTIDVIKITPFGILVKETDKQKQSLYSLVVEPIDTSNTTKVEIRFRTNLLRLIFDELKNLAPSSLNPILKSLRQYLESPKQFYGFPMAFTKITDSLVLTTTSEAAAKDVTDSLRQMFNRLHWFVQQHSLPVFDSPIAYIQRIQATRKKLMAAIPVSKEAPTKPPLEFLRMPDGRMLTVDFTGDYRNIQRAYLAADRYINDYDLKPVALPYERYITHPISAEDSTRMKIRIYFPVL